MPAGETFTSFLHSHFNDCLLIPAALPVVLWIQHLVRLRLEDKPPLWQEMFLHLIVWSVICKYLGPHHLHIGTPDVWDVTCYFMGGVISCLWWNRGSFLLKNKVSNGMPDMLTE